MRRPAVAAFTMLLVGVGVSSLALMLACQRALGGAWQRPKKPKR